MEENLAYCGLICRKCTIYLATREKDADKKYRMKVEIAREIQKHYGRECEPEDVGDCDGCKTEGGRLFCTGCEIRVCAVQKGFESCAYCNDYPCKLLEKLFTTDPDAGKRLDSIRAAL